MLFHCFRKRDLSMIEPDADDRIDWGTALQHPILEAVAKQYRLEMQHNDADEYVRDGLLGATVDGRMVMPDRGKVIVEAKCVDWLRWKQTWTETAAAMHVEIQVQTQVMVDKAELGMIAVLIGGNDLRVLEREPNREMQERLRDEAASFFDSLKTGKEPDPLGSPLELPMLAALYPLSEKASIVEAFGDEEMSLVLRQYARAKSDESFAKKLAEQMKAKLLGRAGPAGILKTDGFTAFIKRTEVAAGMCEPHLEPKVTRKASTRINIEIVEENSAPVADTAKATRDPADYLGA
jgi:predicted phage-related endonuclease